ncbi:MAG: FISUMP domain-containing protein [Bacteroidetes bacterium]|nr:FISUMP domain-containing protein [Bacteroidota bacterium]
MKLTTNPLFFALPFIMLIGIMNSGKAQDNNDCQSLNYQGYTYALVEIGDQCWFAENLRTRRYANGDSIISGFVENSDAVGRVDQYKELAPNESYDTEGWTDVEIDIYLSFGEAPEGANLVEEVIFSPEHHGLLYNWYTVHNDRDVCPIGWHVPEIAEFEMLQKVVESGKVDEEQVLRALVADGDDWELSMDSIDHVSGKELINAAGFWAYPSGVWETYGGEPAGFWNSNHAAFWTTSLAGPDAWSWDLQGNWYYGDLDGEHLQRTSVGKHHRSRMDGCSIRCLRD